MRQRRRRRAGRDRQRKKKKTLALSSQLPSHGREAVNSHAPVVRLKNLGLYHSIQHSNSIHGRLLGRELVILHISSSVLSPSFHMPFSTQQESAFCLPQYPPPPPGFPGHHVTRKQAVPFCSSCKRQVNTNSIANSPGGARVRRSLLILKIQCSPVKQNLALPQRVGRPAGDTGEAPILRKAKEQR